MHRILIIEDDFSLNNTLAYNLRTAGYTVDSAYNAKEALGFIWRKTLSADNMALSTCFLPFMWAVPLKFGLSTQTLLNKKNAATGFSITRNGIFLYYFIQPSLHYQILNMS